MSCGLYILAHGTRIADFCKAQCLISRHAKASLLLKNANMASRFSTPAQNTISPVISIPCNDFNANSVQVLKFTPLFAGFRKHENTTHKNNFVFISVTYQLSWAARRLGPILEISKPSKRNKVQEDNMAILVVFAMFASFMIVQYLREQRQHKKQQIAQAGPAKLPPMAQVLATK